MDSKLAIGLLSILCLAGITIAHGGYWQNNTEKAQIPDEVAAQMLEAVHTCDYDAAKALSEEYGFGKRRMAFSNEEVFNMGCEIRDAIDEGDYEKAVQLRKEKREKVYGVMSELREQGLEAHGPFRGKRSGMGFNCMREE